MAPGHRVVAMTTPGLAPSDAFETKPTTFNHAMTNDGLEAILRTGGLVTAARSGAANEMQRGRHESLVAANEQANDRFHVLGLVLRIPARCAVRRTSWRRSATAASLARHRPIMTSKSPSASFSCSSRTTCRRLRRIRLRTTALPSFLLVMRPKRNFSTSESRSTESTT